ncbi:MAG: type II secretion system protein GspM [Chromatiales bacterium]
MTDLLERYHVPLAWGLLGLVLAFALSTAAAPLARYHSTLGSEIERDYRTLAKLRAINALRGATAEQSKEIREQLFGSYLFSDVSSADDLALEIRKLIDGLAAQYELRLNSVEGVSPRRDGELVHAGVRIRATASTSALHEILRELESHRPLIFIERLSLSPTRSGYSTARAQARARPVPQTLVVDMEVSGYFLESGEAEE